MDELSPHLLISFSSTRSIPLARRQQLYLHFLGWHYHQVNDDLLANWFLQTRNQIGGIRQRPIPNDPDRDIITVCFDVLHLIFCLAQPFLGGS